MSLKDERKCEGCTGTAKLFTASNACCSYYSCKACGWHRPVWCEVCDA